MNRVFHCVNLPEAVRSYRPSPLLLPSPIPHSPSKACAIDGCMKQTYGKLHCRKHAIDIKNGKTPEAGIPKALLHLIHSDCCDEVCTKGERHEYGEQYCSKCGKACCWKIPIKQVAGSAAF